MTIDNGWIAIGCHIVGNLDDWRISYSSDYVVRMTRKGAIDHGLVAFGSDDFLIGQVLENKLIWLCFQYHAKKEEDERADAASQLGLT